MATISPEQRADRVNTAADVYVVGYPLHDRGALDDAEFEHENGHGPRMTGPIAVSTATLVFIVIPIAVAWIVGVVDILRRGLPASQKVLWIVVVIVFPIVGLLVYFTLRKPTEAEVRASQAAAADRRGR